MGIVFSVLFFQIYAKATAVETPAKPASASNGNHKAAAQDADSKTEMAPLKSSSSTRS